LWAAKKFIQFLPGSKGSKGEDCDQKNQLFEVVRPTMSDTNGHSGPVPHPDEGDRFGLGGQFPPCVAGGVENGVVIFEDGV
jgi:hypothetical protein